MKTFFETQIKPNLALISVGLCLLMLMFQCSTNVRIKILEHQLTKSKKEVVARQDSLQTRTELLLEINRVKTQQRIVYDNNSIVRTVIRPDDVIMEYQRVQDSLERKLNGR